MGCNTSEPRRQVLECLQEVPATGLVSKGVGVNINRDLIIGHKPAWMVVNDGEDFIKPFLPLKPFKAYKTFPGNHEVLLGTDR